LYCGLGLLVAPRNESRVRGVWEDWREKRPETAPDAIEGHVWTTGARDPQKVVSCFPLVSSSNPENAPLSNHPPFALRSRLTSRPPPSAQPPRGIDPRRSAPWAAALAVPPCAVDAARRTAKSQGVRCSNRSDAQKNRHNTSAAAFRHLTLINGRRPPLLRLFL